MGKARDLPGERLFIHRHCPGWRTKWLTVDHTWSAKSPTYEEDGITVEGHDAAQLVARVRRMAFWLEADSGFPLNTAGPNVIPLHGMIAQAK